MAIVTNWYTMDGKLGVWLNFTITSLTTDSNLEYPAPPAKLGDRVQGNMDSEWVFVRASTTVTQFMAIAIDNSGNANDLTSALIASHVYTYGIAEFQTTQANPGDYFWALLRANGGVAVQVSPSAGRGVQLYISPLTPGAFTSSVTSNAIMGIELVASIGTSASGPGEAVLKTYMIAALDMAVAGATV